MSVGGVTFCAKLDKRGMHVLIDCTAHGCVTLMVRVSVVLVCLVTCMSISLTSGFVGEEVGEGPRLPPSKSNADSAKELVLKRGKAKHFGPVTY